jgi:hypothetical protein
MMKAYYISLKQYFSVCTAHIDSAYFGKLYFSRMTEMQSISDNFIGVSYKRTKIHFSNNFPQKEFHICGTHTLG